MNILPSRYDKLNLGKSERQLIETLESKYGDDDNSYFFLKTSPTGINNLHVFISNEGVVFVEPIEIADIHIFISIRSSLEIRVKENMQKLYNRLTQHKKLKVKGENGYYLKFPFTYKIFLSQLRYKDTMVNGLSDKDKDFIMNFCIFKDSKPTEDNLLFRLAKGFNQMNDLIESMYSNIDHPYWKDWDEFTNEDINYILQMICPEYTIPIVSEEELENSRFFYTITNTKNEDIYMVNENDFNVKVHRLDDEQINIINNMRKGNQLILACAGSGKSVILISKAFKAASIHPDKRFLITCFNRNLASYYNWKISLGGYRQRNVESMTFHKLLQILLHEARISYSNYKHDENFEKAKEALKAGKIKRRYYGIFLDEIQIFKPEWYEFCYNLLENHQKDNYFFTICGDISQNINRNIKKGKAPWQRPENANLPKYTGRSLRIEKNYRNSIGINDMMKNFIEVAKSYIKEFNIELENEEDTYLLGKAFRKGFPPKAVMTNRFKLTDCIVDEISDLNEKKNVPLNRIAVLFPYRKYAPLRYYFMSWLENKLNENFIDYYTLVSGRDGQLPAYYGNNKGVALSTIESSLGLDFDAVILAGLLPLGKYYNSKDINVMRNREDDNQEIEQEFIDSINKVYTACTRAKDHLTIFLEEDEDESLYSKIILESVMGVGNIE
ncbi:hypothetical protein CULT_1760002 [[Clostridium] ultunense Esp]|uniref:UvrD-like helicase C-terminal domain-containing protein n=1 Tax=[Clostridium] ultunense Esp TaxID=1288971 RepID=M1YUN3_9FIRM|nr:3'-5' exonuclease [Schnuerera ultunensis]CCQ94235.1 hypothetical protein CULT_1760002 [[Clostridium] ultunense Esp]SHD76811.1 conserved protein of unknown function [[Clostridium] ultunense Esp]